MRNVLLIGFDYDKSLNWATLPGIVIDLYLIYKITQKSRPDKISVITDIICDLQTKILKQAILDQIVDDNVLEFIDILKERKQHFVYYDYEMFMDQILKACMNSSQLFIYYTGHSKDGYMILPDETFILFSKFRSDILSYCNSICDIIIITDCCQGTCMGFPYRLMLENSPNNNNSIKSLYRLTPNQNKIFPKQNIICISSAMNDQQSIATRDGSFFTQSLYKLLNDHIRNLSHILYELISNCKLKYAQTAMIHASQPNMKFIWGWLYGNSNLMIIQNINMYCIEIIRYNCNNNNTSLDMNSTTSENIPNKKEEDENINVTFSDTYISIQFNLKN